MNMIINLLGKYIVIADMELRKVVALIENDLGLIRYLLKVLREYTLSEENGYLKFENRSGEVYLHRVIMEYYSQYDTRLYNTYKANEVNHKNKRRWDNRLENLEIVNRDGNMNHKNGLEYEVLITSQEIIQIKDKLKEDKKYQAHKKYLERISRYNTKYFNNMDLYCCGDSKVFDNLYMKFSNTNKTAKIIAQNTTITNILSDFTKIIFLYQENTFFTSHNISYITKNYNYYRCRNICTNNLKLIFKYYKKVKYFRELLEKYKLVDLNIDKKKIQKTNMLIDIFITYSNRTYHHFNKNNLCMTIPLQHIMITYAKYNGFRILYLLQLLERKHINYTPKTNTASSFFIPKYTDKFFTTTVLPLAKQLYRDKPTKITHTIFTKNYGLDTAQRVYKEPKRKYKTHKDLFTITDIITVLNSSSILERIQKYGFITVSHIRKELQLMNPNIKETDDSFITSMVRNITEIKDLLKTLKVEYTTINNKTKEKIKHYQENNKLEETTYEGITHRQNLIVLKKLVVKNNKTKKSTKKKQKQPTSKH